MAPEKFSYSGRRASGVLSLFSRTRAVRPNAQIIMVDPLSVSGPRGSEHHDDRAKFQSRAWF